LSISDVAGVFSRYFVVGFFVPAFIVLVALSQVLTKAFLPSSYERYADSPASILILGGAALVVALILDALNDPLMRVLQGSVLRDAPLPVRRAISPVDKILSNRQLVLYDRFVARRDSSSSEVEKTKAAWILDRRFPRSRARVLPSHFGNVLRATSDHPTSRWGLDMSAAWPRIEMLLNEREQDLHATAKGQLNFFLNGALLVLVGGGVFALDHALHRSVLWIGALVAAIALSYALYRLAVGAAIRWGTEVRASVDLHRLELYEKVGLRAPREFAEERTTIAPLANACLLYGFEIPDGFMRSQDTANE